MMHWILCATLNHRHQPHRVADLTRARSSTVSDEHLRSLRSGFTMVKLLVVIVVIAILAVITIVVYNGITGRPTESSTKSDQRNAETAVERDKTTSESYPTDAGAASDDQGLNPSGDHQLTYKKSGNNSCGSASNANISTSLCLKSPSQQIPDGVPGTDVVPEVVVSTLAGSGTAGFTDGTGAAAQFDTPAGVAVDASGTVYLADAFNHRIRKISPAGVVSTLAGSGTPGSSDSTGTAAQFNTPLGVAVDSYGTVYVADSYNNLIRKITPAGVVSTLAGSTAGSSDGTGAAAQFYYPAGIAVDSSGTVYVADIYNNLIRKITPAGVVSTLAGSTRGFADGTGAAAQFNDPGSVAVDSSGTVYVTDSGNNLIRKISPAGVVSTLAGSGTPGSSDGTGAAAQFNYPFGVAVDTSGTVYVADAYNHRIRKITPAGVVSTLAGSTAGFADGTGAAAQFTAPTCVAVGSSGTVYVTDTYNHRIRKITQ
jgi:type II secretory pathway pseudopilin PulG/sugar lactone lactonase YvrE